MREFERKRLIRSVLCSRYMILVYIIAILFLGNAVYGAYGKYKQGRTLEQAAQREFNTLKEREVYLTSHVESIGGTTGQSIEVLDRFGLVKPGEHLIILVGDDSTVKKGKESNTGLLGKFWNFITGN
jgi:hypothetical protein